MSSIQKVFAEKSAGPYQQAIKVQVVAVSKPLTYKGRDGTEKKSLTCAVSDGSTMARAVCYDATKFGKMKIGTALVIRNFIRRTEDNIKMIILTSTSKLFMTTPIEVPEDHGRQGEFLINPPAAELVSITAALASPVKRRNSITGKVVQEDEPREVNVNHTDVKIKNVTVEDATGKAKVTLWRETSTSDIRTGDFVEITDVVINIYKNETSLSTTGKSTVKKIDTPSITKTVKVEAVGVTEDTAELFLDSGEVISVSVVLLKSTLESDGDEVEDVEMIVSDGPLDFIIETKGAEVVNMKKVK